VGADFRIDVAGGKAIKTSNYTLRKSPNNLFACFQLYVLHILENYDGIKDKVPNLDQG